MIKRSRAATKWASWWNIFLKLMNDSISEPIHQVFLILLLTTAQRFSQSRSQSSNAMVRKPFASSFSCSAGKGNQYLHWACQQMKTWSALKVSARSLLDNHEQHRQMTRHQKSSQFTETSWQRSLINWSHLGFFFNQYSLLKQECGCGWKNVACRFVGLKSVRVVDEIC